VFPIVDRKGSEWLVEKLELPREIRERNGYPVMIDLSDFQIAYMKPKRVSSVIDWLQHVPFAFALAEWHRPDVFVELGTRTGVSYCAFCQAVEHLGLSTKCYAVDTWKGDEHAGFYPEKLYEEFSMYHDLNYRAFSVLLRMTFDEALSEFSDGSVDLLHIDGLHTWEAVKHDFETWLPKMSNRGIILLHDTNIRQDTFGVWRLFEESKAQYRTFEFLHGHGLGVVAVGDLDGYDKVNRLFSASDEETVLIRNLLSALGERLDLAHRVEKARQAEDELHMKLVVSEQRLSEMSASLAAREKELQIMQHSLSWRITRPLRWVHDRLVP